jgi:hypothetical protein
MDDDTNSPFLPEDDLNEDAEETQETDTQQDGDDDSEV